MFLIECTIFWLRLKTAKSYSTGKDTNKAEDKPPDKSKEGSEYVYPCIDLSEYTFAVFLKKIIILSLLVQLCLWTKHSLKISDQSQGSQTNARGYYFVEPLCSVCHNSCQELVEAPKCGHSFCQSCVHHTSSDVFVCRNEWCVSERSQPIGIMSWRTEKQSLRGYDDCCTIAVNYNFPSGIQGGYEINE